MDKNSIHHFVNSADWLRHRTRKGHAVPAEDIAQILSANPTLVPDADLHEYILKGLRGQLGGTPGRPAKTARQKLMLHLAAHQVDVLTRWCKRAKKRGYDYASDPKRARLGLSEYVHEKVARRLKLGSGRSLANDLSSLKRRPY